MLGKDGLNGYKIKRCGKRIVSEGQRGEGTLGEVWIEEDLWVMAPLFVKILHDANQHRHQQQEPA